MPHAVATGVRYGLLLRSTRAPWELPQGQEGWIRALLTDAGFAAVTVTLTPPAWGGLLEAGRFTVPGFGFLAYADGVWTGQPGTYELEADGLEVVALLPLPGTGMPKAPAGTPIPRPKADAPAGAGGAAAPKVEGGNGVVLVAGGLALALFLATRGR